MRTFGVIAWLIAMIFNVGCASESKLDEASQYVMMDVNNLWQGSVPVEYENIETACQNREEPNLLIPYSISANSSLQIELYACWVGPSLTDCGSGKTFKEARVDTDGNKVTVSLWHSYLTDDECGEILGGLEHYHTIEINEPWQRGELEIVVQNSGDDLTGFITVE